MNKSTCWAAEPTHSKGYLRGGLCDKHAARMRKYGSPYGKSQASLLCTQCGEPFTARTTQAKYCGQRCRDMAKGLRIGLTCCDCGKPMQCSATSAPQGKAKCSECRKAHDGVTAKEGCKCAACKTAKSNYMVAYKERIRAEHGVHYTTLFRRKFKETTGIRYSPGSKEWISPTQRVELYERDNWTCHLCGEPVNTDGPWNHDMHPSLDHLIPRSHGGSDDPDNLKTAHRVCNSKRHNTPLDEYMDQMQNM